MFTADLSSFDFVLNRKSFAAHSFFADVEQSGALYTLVIRGSDKVAKTVHADCFEDRILHADDTIKARNHRSFIVASGDDAIELSTGATDLIEFYSTTAPFSEKYAKLGAVARAVMPVISMVFGHQSRKKDGWKVGSFHGLSGADAKKRNEKLDKSAKDLSDPDVIMNAVKAAMGVATDSAPSPEMVKLMAQVALSMQAIGLTMPTMPTIAPTAATVVQSPVLAVVADEQSLGIDDLMEELANPTDASAEVYAQVIDHIATDGSAEALYIEALEGSEDNEQFVSACQTLLSEALEAA